jgi:hypothetical protein
MPKPAPRRRVGHRPWRTSYITNSARGAAIAQRLGEHVIDNDFHLTYGGQDWGNDHGAPSHVFFRKGDRMERHPSSVVFAKRVTINGHEYHIRGLREALEDNHRHGLNTEIEIKDVRPWATAGILDARLAEIAATAEAVYGGDWQRHVVVKVLTNLGGGLRYALKICRIAHAHGIPTMLLARGRARFMRFRGHPEITYVRGSAVIR